MRNKLQTFLPFSSFEKSAYVLDQKRLGKQRLESQHIIKLITNTSVSKAWINHPATLMWHGYSNALKLYFDIFLKEWLYRGYNNSYAFFNVPMCRVEMPPWLGKRRLHSSHRAALLDKNIHYYERFNWSEKPHLNYWWPVGKLNGK